MAGRWLSAMANGEELPGVDDQEFDLSLSGSDAMAANQQQEQSETATVNDDPSLEGTLVARDGSPASSAGSATRQPRAKVVRTEPKLMKGRCWNLFAKVEGQEKATCVVCKKDFGCKDNNTTGLNRHGKTHKEDWAKVQQTVPVVFHGSHNHAALAIIKARVGEQNEENQRDTLLRFVVRSNSAFDKVDLEEFKDMLYSCGKNTPSVSHATLKRDLIAAVSRYQPEVFNFLAGTCRGNVSLTLDCWGAPRGQQFFGIVGHWLTDDFQPNQILLHFEEMTRGKNNRELRSELDNMLQKWDLEGRVGCMTSDSAGENLAMMEIFSAQTGWDLDNMVRCSNHGQQKAVDILLEEPTVAKVVAKARKQEQYLDRYGGHRFKWLEAKCKQYGLPCFKMAMMNDTRWGSCFRLLQDILPCSPELEKLWLLMLQELNNHFLNSGKAAQAEKDKKKLSNVAWELCDFQVIRDVRKLLDPFKEVMVLGQTSTQVSLNMTCHNYEYLMDCLAPALVPAWLRPTAALMVEKLEEYYGYTMNVHYVATCLDPTLKLAPYAGPREKGQVTYNQVRTICIDKLQRYFDPPALVQPPVPEPPPQSTARRNQREDPNRLSPMQALLAKLPEDNEFEARLQKRHKAMAASRKEPSEELLRYLRDDRAAQGTDPLVWWRENKERYPKLWKAARDILPGQTSSASIERIFSTGRDLCTPKRSHLLSDTIRACMMLYSWFQHV